MSIAFKSCPVRGNLIILIGDGFTYSTTFTSSKIDGRTSETAVYMLSVTYKSGIPFGLARFGPAFSTGGTPTSEGSEYPLIRLFLGIQTGIFSLSCPK